MIFFLDAPFLFTRGLSWEELKILHTHLSSWLISYDMGRAGNSKCLQKIMT